MSTSRLSQKTKAEIGVIVRRFARRKMDDANAAWWGVCVAASVIVGRYEPGATLGLASALGLSVSAVTQMAGAGDTYLALARWARKNGQLAALAQAKRSLGYSYFYLLGQKVRRYDLRPQEQIDYLLEAAEDRPTVDNFTIKIDSEHSGQMPAPLVLQHPGGGGNGETLARRGDSITAAHEYEKEINEVTGEVSAVTPLGLGRSALRIEVDSDTAPAPGDKVKVRIVKRAALPPVLKEHR